MAALNHPNITTVYEVGEYEGSAFIAMEYVEGQSLYELLNKQSLTVRQSLDITAQLCEGLAEAHKRGIVHRDIKPGNIIIEQNNRLKILDFGLAKLKEVTRKTSTLTTVGTLYYLSPEQIQTTTVDQRSDIFSAGIVLYEMISGQLPFKGEHEAAVIYSILNEEPEPLTRYKAGLSENLQRIVSKSLQKNPEMRYQHADDLLSDIKHEQRNTESSSTTTKKKVGDKLTRKLAAIMFTDIVGYSQMMSKDEDVTFKLLQDYDSIVTPIIAQHNGQILKKIGDGLFCEFSSAIEAVECSIEIQKSLHKYNKTASKNFELMVRIGLHVGDVIKKGSDLFGDGVNVAARIEPLAPPGGVYVSDSIYSAISSHPKYTIVNLGQRSLKNINKEHTLHQIITGFEIDSTETKTTTKRTTATKTKGKTTPVSSKSGQLLKGKKNAAIAVLSLFLIMVLFVLYKYTGVFDPSQPLSEEDYSESANQSTKDQITVDSDISELLNSEKSQSFRSAIAKISDTDVLLQYLEQNKDNGNLLYGTQKDFPDLERKYIIITDENKVYTILLYFNQKYYDVYENKLYQNLSDNFQGKFTIWIDLL
jgi:serine/threonine protein kinase